MTGAAAAGSMPVSQVSPAVVAMVTTPSSTAAAVAQWVPPPENNDGARPFSKQFPWFFRRHFLYPPSVQRGFTQAEEQRLRVSGVHLMTLLHAEFNK